MIAGLLCLLPMNRLAHDNPLALETVAAIRAGNVEELDALLAANPELATSRIVADDGVQERSLLHISTDWPGKFPNSAATIRCLVAHGADVNARYVGDHRETALHWAVSCNDVAAVDALLDAGADIEADGAVLGGGSAMADAVGFAQWDAARRLVERGARTTLGEAAALGLLDRVEHRFATDPPAKPRIDVALWFAASGGQIATAEFLVARGADPNWVPDWEPCTALDAAERNGFPEMANWLREHGGGSAKG